MQTEEQKPLESTAQADSTAIKKQHGGKRPGAGRRPNLAKQLLKGFSRDAIAEAMAPIDVGMVIAGLLKSKSDRTKLETLIFVRDTLIGRPAQNVTVAGGLVHAHAWRPLATLSDDEVALLDRITAKLTAPKPVLDVAQDAPHNQVNSTVAIEAEVMESEANT